jgi:hypothetical protein
MHIHRDHGMVDEFENDFDFHVDRVKAIIQDGSYVEILGWIQWVLRRKDCPSNFSETISQALQQGRAAYRVADGGTIFPFGSEEQADTVGRAFADLAATEFHGARHHLRRSAEELSAGRAPDSIRESIHAVESVVRVLESDGDFSKALARLEANANIHGALRRGFAALGTPCSMILVPM